MHASRDRPPRLLWAYTYRITRTSAELRLDGLQLILDGENAAARAEARTWSGRIVPNHTVTCILVVSGSARQSLPVNRLLEAELGRLNVEYLRTSPIAIPRGEDPDLTLLIDIPPAN